MKSSGSVAAVTLGTLMEIVASIHGVPVDRRPALKGRFRNFSKMGIPDVPKVGVGSRAEYWPEHVAIVLVAFELVRFRMPQTAAALAMKTHRTTTLKAIGDAGRLLTSGRSRAPVLLKVESNALLEDAKRPELADVTITRVDTKVASASPAGVASIWTIDVVRLVELAVEGAERTDEPLDAGFFARLT